MKTTALLPVRFWIGFLIVITVLFGGTSAVQGATRTWDGSTSIYWSDPSNWVENDAPSDGDSLVFPAGALNVINDNNIVGLNLNSIKIEAPGYSLNGFGVGLTDQLWISVNQLIVTWINLDITLDDDATIYTYSFNNNLHVQGNINLSANNLRVGGYGRVILYGVVSGSGTVTKFGNGTVELQGSSGNTFIGSTTVEDGTLVLNKTTGDSVPDDLIIEDGATVRQDTATTIGDDVIIFASGTYDMNGFGETIDNLTLYNGADFNSGTSMLTIRDDVTVSGGSSSISGKLYLLTGDSDFNILYNLPLIFPNAHCYLYADVTGNGNLIKKGSGFMRISGNNTYTGTTVVENGMIQIESSTALGSSDNGTTVNAGTTVYLSAASPGSSNHIVDEDLALGGRINSYGVSNSWTGAILLTDDATISVSSGNYLNLVGAISGAGGITKNSGGTLIYSGASANSYTGDTTVNNGTLELQGSTRIRTGTLTIGNNTGARESVVVRFRADNPIHSNTDTVINSDGLLDFNNYTDYIGDVLFDRGKLSTGTGTYRMGGNVSVIESFSTNWNSMISGYVDLSNVQRTFDVDTGAFLDLSAPTEGDGGITKAGAGWLRLGWPNTYTGETIAQAGVLQLWHAGSLGATNSGTVVQSGATLYYGKSLDIVGEELELNGFGASGYGALHTYYDASWQGPVELTADSEIYVGSGDRLEIDGAVSGSGGLTKSSSGTLAFVGNDANTYTGDTYVNTGTLALEKTIGNGSLVGNLYIGDGSGGADADVVRLDNTSQIPNSTRITIAGSGLFDMNNITEYFGSLAGSGHVVMGNGSLAAGYDNTSTTFSGQIEGTGEFHKRGSGSMELSGNNTYSGETRIYSGTLLVNGSQPGSDVTVSSSGTLGGIGTVGDIDCYGTVAPGNSAGQLGCGSATFQSGSSFDVELDGYTLVDYDQLDVGGVVSLGSSISDLNITWGFVPAVGDTFTIIDNDGGDAVSGIYNGLAEGNSVLAGNVTLQISYAGGTGNDVVLAATAVSELEPLTITSIEEIGGNIRIEWVGGVPYYVVEKKTSLTNATWSAVTAPTRDLFTTVPADTTNGFYRVTGQ